MKTPVEVAREAMADERVTIWEHEPDEVARLGEHIAEYAAEVREAARAEALDVIRRDLRTHCGSCGESPAQTEMQAGRDQGVKIGLEAAIRIVERLGEP